MQLTTWKIIVLNVNKMVENETDRVSVDIHCPITSESFNIRRHYDEVVVSEEEKGDLFSVQC